MGAIIFEMPAEIYPGGGNMLDAVIIADSGSDTYSVSSPFRLQVDGRSAVIQNIRNYIENNGKIIDPVRGENAFNWHGAPKLNGIALMSHLLKEGFAVDLIDSYDAERERFIALLRARPKAVIISTTFILNKRMLHRLVEDIRMLAGGVFIVAGGPFVYSSYLLMQRAGDRDYDTDSPSGDYLFLTGEDRPDVDLFIVDPDGKTVLSEVLDRIRHAKGVRDLPNLAYWDKTGYVFTPRREAPGCQTDIMIDWRVIPDRFFSRGMMNVQASRGCPFHCEFCNFVKEAKHTHIKPMDALLSELSDLVGRGVKYVRFVDDNFRLGKKDLDDFCRALIRENLDIYWMSFIRASTLESADPGLLRQAGCIEVQMGIESADKTVLENMNKRADPDMYYRVITDLLQNGINCSCCFLVGFPGETNESFQRTLNFIESIPALGQTGLFFWSLYAFLLAPLSPVYEPSQREKYRLSGYMDSWRHFSMDADTARALIGEAFDEIQNSSPIYSGDNLEMIGALTPLQKKRFFNVRHNLGKRTAGGANDPAAIIAAFSKIFQMSDPGIRGG